MGGGAVVGTHAEALRSYARGAREDFLGLLTRLVEAESPSHDAASQRGPQAVLREAFEDLGYAVTHLPGHETGGHLYARPEERVRGRPAQLLVGHSDTVWPVGTLAEMPLREEDGLLYGPGAADMKGGVVLMILALRALRELGLEPSLTPVALINSDEEIGSPESMRWMALLARRVRRALVLEPASEGRVKTARKGPGHFTVTVRGKAAHAGLTPEEGASAIHEMARVITALEALNDPEAGTTVNVGVVRGGTASNVVAAEASAEVDMRVTTLEEGRRLEEAVRSIEPSDPRIRIEVEGGLRVPPLERTPRNRRLWTLARDVGAELGMELEEVAVGGGSDGNTTSRYTATLDGLGVIGAGLHAAHEHLEIDASLERIALLAGLLLAPDVSEEDG